MTFVYLFLTSLCITGSRFIHITLTDSNLFLFMAEKYSISTIMGRRFKREGTCVYLWLIHVVVRQKPTQYCTAIILQLKHKKKKIKKELPQMWEWGGHFKAHLRTYSLTLCKWKIRLKNSARRNLGDIQQSLGFRLESTGSKTPKSQS